MAEEIPTLPLFKMRPEPKRRSTGETAKRATVVGWVKCPRCHAGERAAVLRDGDHLVYRPHVYRTWSGAPMECPASWQRLCTLKPKPWHGPRNIAGCICGGTP